MTKSDQVRTLTHYATMPHPWNQKGVAWVSPHDASLISSLGRRLHALQSWPQKHEAPSTASRCVTSLRIPGCPGTLAPSPEYGLATGPDHPSESPRYRLAAASREPSRWRRGASGSSGLHPTTGAVRVRTSLGRSVCPSELGQSLAVMRLCSAHAPRDSAKAWPWDEWGYRGGRRDSDSLSPRCSASRRKTSRVNRLAASLHHMRRDRPALSASHENRLAEVAKVAAGG
jgi:hypothetical protein